MYKFTLISLILFLNHIMICRGFALGQHCRYVCVCLIISVVYLMLLLTGDGTVYCEGNGKEYGWSDCDYYTHDSSSGRHTMCRPTETQVLWVSLYNAIL
jgi:hypothetical protein